MLSVASDVTSSIWSTAMSDTEILRTISFDQWIQSKCWARLSPEWKDAQAPCSWMLCFMPAKAAALAQETSETSTQKSNARFYWASGGFDPLCCLSDLFSASPHLDASQSTFVRCSVSSAKCPSPCLPPIVVSSTAAPFPSPGQTHLTPSPSVSSLVCYFSTIHRPAVAPGLFWIADCQSVI